MREGRVLCQMATAEDLAAGLQSSAPASSDLLGE